MLETKVFLYNFSDLKLIDTYETCKNEKGLISLNTDSEKTILACLDKEEGKVNIHFVGKSIKKISFLNLLFKNLIYYLRLN